MVNQLANICTGLLKRHLSEDTTSNAFLNYSQTKSDLMRGGQMFSLYT